jgi:hypothetical protein
MKIIYTDSKEYVLTSDEEIFLGSLKFENWHSQKAQITTQFGDFFDIGPQGFWGTTMGITKGGDLFGDLKMNWKGHIVIDFLENGKNLDYLLKSKNMWMTQYALFNRQEKEVLILTVDYKWNKAHYNFKIDINPDFVDVADETVVLVAAYSVLYLMMAAAAAV